MIERFEAGVLPAKAEWQSHISALKSRTVPAGKEAVRDALLAAVRERIPKGKFGLMLSGGLDSSLLAFLLKKEGADFVAVSVGMRGSPDVESARRLAKELELSWAVRECTDEEVAQLAKEVSKMIPQKDIVNLSVGAVELAAARLGKEHGVSLFFGGLGSEEIFAGYKEHIVAKDINEACWAGMMDRLHDRDLTRDAALGSALGISVRCPFLDDAVIVAAMGIPASEKYRDGQKKFVLREIAEELGLPREWAWRKRLAAQYGSGFDKALERIAKKKGVQKSVIAQRM